jgi:hypothetical protein
MSYSRKILDVPRLNQKARGNSTLSFLMGRDRCWESRAVSHGHGSDTYSRWEGSRWSSAFDPAAKAGRAEVPSDLTLAPREPQQKRREAHKLLPYPGHKAGGKFQPTPANALEGLAFENSEGESRKRSLRPHDASLRNAVLCQVVAAKSGNRFPIP